MGCSYVQSGRIIGEQMRYIGIFLRIVFLISLSACSLSNQTDEVFPIYEHVSMHKDYSKTFYPIEGEALSASSSYVVNFDTGDVLLDKNSNKSLPVASMSKIMSELLILEAIETGALQWEDEVEISEYAYTISNTLGIDAIAFEEDASYRVEDLFHAMAIRSSNAATIALAEAVAGSEKEFVKLMNEKTEELQLDQSTFVNSTGLTNHHIQEFYTVGDVDDANEMSAKDVATLATYLIEHFPHLLDITSQLSVDFHGESFDSTNLMLPGADLDEFPLPEDIDIAFEGMDGFKTGFTDEAGYCFVGTAQIDHVRFISVVIGADEMIDRFIETKSIYMEIMEQKKGIKNTAFTPS